MTVPGFNSPARTTLSRMNLSEDEIKVYEVVKRLYEGGDRNRGIDRIVDETGLPKDRATQVALRLDHLGVIKEIGDELRRFDLPR